MEIGRISRSGAIWLLLLCLLLTLGLGTRVVAAEILAPLDVALGDVSLNKVPFLIAADNGLYSKNRLDVHQFITPGAAAVARRSGVTVPAQYVRQDIETAPVEIGGGSPMMYRAVNNPNAVSRVILATTESVVRFHLIAIPAISKIEELRGKRLGYSVPGAVSHVAALSWSRRMGWTPGKDIILVGNSNSLDPLKEGTADAVMGSAMLSAIAPEMNLKDIADLETYRIPVAGSGIMAERRWLEANHDTAARFVKASIEAFALMAKDQRVFNASLAKWFAISDPKTQQRMYAEIAGIPRKPYPALAGIENIMALYDSPAMRSHKAADFYDSSFIADLDRSGFIDALYR